MKSTMKASWRIEAWRTILRGTRQLKWCNNISFFSFCDRSQQHPWASGQVWEQLSTTSTSTDVAGQCRMKQSCQGHQTQSIFSCSQKRRSARLTHWNVYIKKKKKSNKNLFLKKKEALGDDPSLQQFGFRTHLNFFVGFLVADSLSPEREKLWALCKGHALWFECTVNRV